MGKVKEADLAVLDLVVDLQLVSLEFLYITCLEVPFQGVEGFHIIFKDLF